MYSDENMRQKGMRTLSAKLPFMLGLLRVLRVWGGTNELWLLSALFAYTSHRCWIGKEKKENASFDRLVFNSRLFFHCFFFSFNFNQSSIRESFKKKGAKRPQFLGRSPPIHDAHETWNFLKNFPTNSIAFPLTNLRALILVREAATFRQLMTSPWFSSSLFFLVEVHEICISNYVFAPPI